jgi:hypothetical protein
VGRGTLPRPPFSAPPHLNEGQPMFEEADLIYRYTRAQAIADGVLIVSVRRIACLTAVV